MTEPLAFRTKDKDVLRAYDDCEQERSAWAEHMEARVGEWFPGRDMKLLIREDRFLGLAWSLNEDLPEGWKRERGVGVSYITPKTTTSLGKKIRDQVQADPYPALNLKGMPASGWGAIGTVIPSVMSMSGWVWVLWGSMQERPRVNHKVWEKVPWREAVAARAVEVRKLATTSS